VEVLSRYIPIFLLVLLRASIFVSFLPYFSSKNLPVRFKIGFAVAMAFVLTPVVEIEIARTALPLLVVREMVMGVVLGLMARFVFFVVEVAGQLMSYAMGLSVATAFNPEIGQSTELAGFYGIVAMLVFLAMDAHHELIYVFVQSYEWLPAGQLSLARLLPEVVSMGSRIFVMALKLSAPVLVVIFVSNIVLGFLSKAAPQLNVFAVGFPVYLAVGFVVMIVGLPVFIQAVGSHFLNMREEMLRVLALAKG